MPPARRLAPSTPCARLWAGGGDQPRTKLFEALCNCILGLAAGRHPLLFCVDDLHWADSTTLDWLIYLGRRLQGQRVLLMGSYRREEARALGELRPLLRQARFSELELEDLDEESILQLLGNLKGSVPVDRAWARRLEQISGGNPFFVLEILRGFLESGRQPTALAGPADLPLPDTVRDAVGLRLERLSPTTRQVLQAGAVIGKAFDHELIHRTSGRAEMELADGLDELVARQLLAEEPDGYRFCHEITQAVVYQDLGQWRLRVLHCRAGEALEILQPDNVAALARHFGRAGEPGPAAR